MAALMTLPLVLAACSSGSSRAAGGAPGTSMTATTQGSWTGAEELYGAAPKRDPRVTYQPDVVLVTHGATAVREVSEDGLFWTMAGDDEDVRALEVGKVMFATSFGVGRVAAIEQVGGDRRVLLTPVGLTDVVRDGDFGSSGPLPLSTPLTYSTPGRPGIVAGGPDATPAPTPTTSAPGHADTDLQVRPVLGPAGTGSSHAGTRAAPADATVPLRAKGKLPAPRGTPAAATVGAFTVTPFCCNPAAGLRVSYDKDGGRFVALLSLRLTAPTIEFHVRISGGTVQEATVALRGALGVDATIEAATLTSAGNVSSPVLTVPVSMTMPLFGLPIPLTATLTNEFQVDMQLGGRAVMKTSGGLKAGGELGFGYKDGAHSVTATTFTAGKSFLDSMTQLSVAPSALVVSWAVKASVGIGLIGFTAGVWVRMLTKLGFVGDGGLQQSLTPCADGSGSISTTYGVGYQIPAVVATAVNFFLRILQVKPIARTGGLAWGPSTLWEVKGARKCRLRPP
ncbi:MAG: hypothetical protein HY830_18345 [Actinobacteria bacterium]|nr:hypothetical protein [Actinomycetota bacterium]